MAEENKWYPLRVTYGRELKLKERLDQLQVTSYIPMRYRKVEKDGKRKTVLVPAVNNLCFAYTTRDVIDRLRSGLLEALPFHYIWDKATSLPIVVPDKAMDDFIKVSSSLEDDLGKVVRIRKSKRVMVELPGMLAVATTYIRGEWLEILDEE